MDTEKSGRFIYEERTKAGLTQKELAEMIGVTDKAVSKWENGRGFPDVSLLKPLSDALNVSVTEIIEGERAKDNALETSDKMIMESFGQRKLILKAASLILTIVGAAVLFLPLYAAVMKGVYGIIFVCLGLLLIGAGIFLQSRGFIMWAEGLKLDFIRLPSALLVLIAAIILEAQSDSFLIAFAAPPDSGIDAFYENCSYFDLTPMGYGLWGPMLTGVLSCTAAFLLVVMIVLKLCKKTAVKLGNTVFTITSIALFFSLTAVFFSRRCMPAETGICLLLMLSTVLQIRNKSDC